MKRIWYLGIFVLLTGCGGKSTSDWIAQLRSKDAAERLHAVKALGQRSGEAELVVPALAGTLRDEDAFLRRDAAVALGELGPAARPAVAALQGALRDKNGGVRKAAAAALQNIDPKYKP
jgi:HEAT repeat protein